MTRAQAIARLKELAASDDTEDAHIEADSVLCELLRELGYGDVVIAWGDIKKWFA